MRREDAHRLIGNAFIQSIFHEQCDIPVRRGYVGMKRLFLCLVVIVSVLLSLATGARAQVDFFYMYGDEYHLQMCDLNAYNSVADVYVWVRLGYIDGFRCVEFGKIEPVGGVVMEFVHQFNPDLMELIMISSDGISACFPACQTDEWTWIYKQGFLIQTPDPFYMTIGPYEGSPYPKILDCDYVEHEMMLISPYAVNQCATMEIECHCQCRPPYLAGVMAEDATHFVLSFDCSTDGETMTAFDNYSLYVKGDPASTVQIGAIADESYYGGPYDYRFTLDEPLEPLTTYTFRVNYIDGYLDDEDGAEIDIEYGPIATLLQEFGATFKDGSVELSWRMASVDDGVGFAISRRPSGGEWTELPSGAVERVDLEFTYLDDRVEPDESYVYRVEYESEGSSTLLFQTESIATPAMPLALEQNVPNPFNPSTQISYYLPEAMDVRLEIYDISGRRVALLADGQQPKGWQVALWDGTDTGSRSVASGVYFYRLRAGKEVISKKMVLLR